MAINKKLIVQEAAAAGGGTGSQEEGLVLHLDATDIDSYDGDGDVWYDIKDHEYTPATDVSEHFNTVLYTGNDTGSNNIAQSITGVGFAPDLVWIKNRQTTHNHYLFDSVRGDGKELLANDESQELINSNNNITLDSDGFTTGTGDATNKGLSGNNSYVAWCFKAGGTPTATNTATSGAMTGNSVSIDDELQTSYTPTDATLYPKKISANTKLGFSTVLFTGTGDSNNKVPHGLDTPPELIIYKNIDEPRSWVVGTDGIDWTKTMKLQDTEGAVSRNYFDNVPPTGNVFEIFSGQANTANDDGSDFIAYCFTSKRGVSKVGGYEGTNAAGNKVYTGFEPAFVMIKSTSFDERWVIYDNKRSTSDPRSKVLTANSTAAEIDTAFYNIDFDRDGFTVNGTANFNNKNAEKFIYYAVAKNTNETSLIPDTDLEIHLDADSFDGSTNTPTTWTDSSGNSNNGTITGATFDSELGNWLDFDGSNDFVDLGDLSGFGYSLSVELWVNPDSTQVQYSSIIDFEHSNDEGWVVYQDNNNTNQYRFAVKDGAVYDISSAFTLSSNTWSHLSFTITSSVMKLYVDGNLVETVSGWSGLGTQVRRLNLGCWGGADGVTRARFFNGRIGQVRVYSSALTQDQIRQNYNFTKPSYPNGYDGSLGGGTSSKAPTWNAGGYFVFDNSNDFVSIPSTATEPFQASARDFTMSMWINRDVATGFEPLISKYGTSSATRSWYFAINASNQLEMGWFNGSTLVYKAATSAIVNTAGVWYHVALAVNATQMNFYTQGVLRNSLSGTVTHTSGGNEPINIGSQAEGRYNFFDGKISKVRMFNRALTGTEIADLEAEGN